MGRMLFLIAVLGITPCLASTNVVTVTVTGPTAIGFFPPTTQKEVDEDDGGLREGAAHVGFALQDLEACLSPRKLMTTLEFTRALRIVDGKTIHKFNFPADWEHSVGIILVTPGKAPKVVLAGAGPSSLSEVGPQAAWKYFSEPKCKRY